VSDGQVRLLLEAAMSAPSAHNLQPWHFVLVRERETKEALAETHECSGMVRDAALVIVVGADRTKSPHWLEDACAAAENLLVAATALELGAVWVAVHPYKEHEAFVRGVLDIPENIGVICMIPVGQPAEEKPPHTKYDPARVHRERF
jgi:nitroreductase